MMTAEEALCLTWLTSTLHADDEQEQADADLTEELKRAERGLREEASKHGRRDPAEQGRAQQNARRHFADDGGLSSPR